MEMHCILYTIELFTKTVPVFYVLSFFGTLPNDWQRKEKKNKVETSGYKFTLCQVAVTADFKT